MNIADEIIRLSGKNISVLIKADEINKEKIKVRIFNPEFVKGAFCDGYIDLWEFNDVKLRETIRALEKDLLEKIYLNRKINENRKKASERKSKTGFKETLF